MTGGRQADGTSITLEHGYGGSGQCWTATARDRDGNMVIAATGASSADALAQLAQELWSTICEMDATAEAEVGERADLWPSGGLSRVRWRHANLGSGGSVEFDDLERARLWHEMYCVNRSPIDPPAGPCAIQRATSTTWPDGAEWRGPWTDVADSRDGQGESR